MTNIHFSSKKDDWSTPQSLFDKLNNEFSFTLDPCSTHENRKCEKHFTKEENGLSKTWKNETVFMNPPYGRTIYSWMKKAFESAQYEGATVVCLIPSRTDTKFWHDFCMNATEVRFIKSRVKFGNQKNAAPFPSAIIVFEKNQFMPITRFISTGNL